MPNFDAKDLLEKYNKGELTEAEKALVETWYLQNKNHAVKVDFEQLEEDRAGSINSLLSEISPAPVRKMWPRYAAAASIVLVAAVLCVLQFRKPRIQQSADIKPMSHEILPGGNKAILVLGNGQQITLSQAQNGKIASQGNVVIRKTASGQVVYSTANGTPIQADVYNTAITPRGGQYAFTLSDGTRVWLNAASSLKFPVAFNGSERRVELTGEAYFEVVHNASKPFMVVTNGQTIEDLGTCFNVNAYNDEAAVKTTLLQGSVKVSASGRSQVLKPGQQSLLKDGNMTIAAADTDEAIAWKNGFFYFKDADIKTVMRQLSRWYDADITYTDNLPERSFSGEISRNINASQLLDILSFKKIRFRIEGKKISIVN